MPIEYRIDLQRHLVVARALGTLSDADVFRYQETVWSRADINGFDELMDMGTVESIIVPSRDRVRQLATLACQMDNPPAGGRFAVVAPQDDAYGLARMYETWRNLHAAVKKEIGVFRTLPPALEFLGLPRDFQPF